MFEGGIQKVLEVFNLSSHFENFTNSIFDVTGVLYFLSVIAICIFLTMQTILKRVGIKEVGKMFFKKKNDNNIDNNDKNVIDFESVENNNNNNKKEKRKFKDSINKKYLKNGSYSSVMIVVFVAIIIVINMI
mgnify:CR=1 FL=1